MSDGVNTQALQGILPYLIEGEDGVTLTRQAVQSIPVLYRRQQLLRSMPHGPNGGGGRGGGGGGGDGDGGGDSGRCGSGRGRGGDGRGGRGRCGSSGSGGGGAVGCIAHRRSNQRRSRGVVNFGDLPLPQQLLKHLLQYKSSQPPR